MKLALHSISYAGVWLRQSRLTLPEFITRAHSLGFEGVMLTAKRPHASLLDMTVDERKRVRGMLAERSLQLAAIAGYNDFCGGTDTPDVPYREMQILYITELAKLARDLCGDESGPIVRVFTGFESDSISFDVQWDWCVQCLKESARRASEFGATLAVQNHHDIGAHYESMVDLLTDVDEPNCMAAFDAWSPALQGTDLADAVRCMSNWIVHTTVADYVRRPRYRYHPRHVNYSRDEDVVRAVPIGDGFIDYTTFFDALRETEYDGFVAYEMCSVLRGGGSEENLDQTASKFIAWMKEHMYAP